MIFFISTVGITSPVSLLVLLNMFRIDKSCRAKAARIRFFSLVLGVNVTVKETLSAKLGAAVAAGIPSFSQVNMPNMSVQVLLLVEPKKREFLKCTVGNISATVNSCKI